MRGADLPWQDPGRDHGTAMEGYYWRIVDPARARVVVALCAVCRAPGGRWALTGMAAAPEGMVRSTVTPTGAARSGAFGARAAGALAGTLEAVRCTPAADLALDVRLRAPRRGGRALGPAHLLPGLPQYWTPLVLGAEVEGGARIGGEEVDLAGAHAYVERNWGPGFPDRWWWGQADDFGGDDVCVAFAGGQLAGRAHASAIVVRVGARIARFPLAAGRDWRLRARWGSQTVSIEGDAAGAQPVLLPIPVPGQRRVEHGARQWLTGRLRVVLRRRGRLVYRGESPLAGLERGAGPGAAGACG